MSAEKKSLSADSGKTDRFLEKILRKFAGDQEGNEKKLLIAGGILWILVILASAAVPMGILYLAEKWILQYLRQKILIFITFFQPHIVKNRTIIRAYGIQ